MARKPASGETGGLDSGDGGKKRYGTLVRVSDEFADVLKKASVFSGTSMANFADEFLLPVAEAKYQELMAEETRRLKGKK